MTPLHSSKTTRLLQTFEAVGRNLSVTKAAMELGVTSSAISHQLRELTDIIGKPLTEKSGRGITLTAVGTKLARELSDQFERIGRFVADAVTGDTHRVRIAVCSAFGPGWLSPRLVNLMIDYPETEYQLTLKSGQPDPNDIDADLFVTTEPGASGFFSTPLFEEMLVAVGNPVRRQSDPRMRHTRFITTDTNEGNVGSDWFDFIKHTKLPLDFSGPNTWLKCSHYILAVELARQDAGVALIPDFLARGHIEAGSLVPFSNLKIPSGRQYHICVKRNRIDEPVLKHTIQWFKTQVTLPDPPTMIVRKPS